MLKTAESVSPKHPDKLCDRISDAILDACLEQDPDSRVAVETMGGHGLITITGELTTKEWVDIPKIVKRIAGNMAVQTNIISQSSEIAKGVDSGGAGDQGIMIGYACRDNGDMIPQELYLARSLCKYIYDQYQEDGKTQITIDENYKIQTIVASFANIYEAQLYSLVLKWLEKLELQKKTILLPRINILTNPAGDWNMSGFEADTGLTGRKLVIDNYGPQIPVGGGCFSGKDATKVDRSGAYMARKIAVDYLNKYLEVDNVMIKLAYSIGIAKPVMVSINANNVEQSVNIVNNFIKNYDLTPKGIIDFLELKKPRFAKTAEWGHFGNNFKWDI